MTTTSALYVAPLGAGRFAVECAGSCGGAGGVHVVIVEPGGVTCDCPAARFCRPCRHVGAVRDFLQLAPLEFVTAAGPGLERDVPPPEPV